MRLSPQSPAGNPWQIRDSHASWMVESPEGQVRLEIDLDGPQPGISQLCYLSKALPGKLLGLTSRAKNGTHAENEDLGWTLGSAYPRGSNLIANYQNLVNPQNTLQIDWRIVPAFISQDSHDESPENFDRACLEIDVVVSLHTESLESYPQITAKTQLACDQFLYVPDPEDSMQPVFLPNEVVAQASEKPGYAVYRLRDLPWSYLEMVYPADFSRWQGNLSANESPSANALNASNEQIFCWDLDCKLLEKGVIRRLQLRALLLPKHNDLTLARRSYAKFVTDKLPL